jgi:hypothetical protein
MPNSTSSSRRWIMASIASTFEPTLSCVSITPLGQPVEPEVKITVSKSSGLTRVRPSCHSSSQTGISHASAAETILSQAVIFPEKSSSGTNSASILKSNFSNIRRLVITCRIPHCLTQEFITSDVTV